MSLAKTSASFDMDENQQMQAVKKVIMERAATATPHTTFLLEPPRQDIGDESSKYQNFITYSKLLFSATKTCVLSVRSLSIQLLLAPDSCGRKLYLLGTGF